MASSWARGRLALLAALIPAVRPAEPLATARCGPDTPCLNGGTCHSPTSACYCAPWFSGALCETLVHPTCQLSPNSTRMACLPWAEPHACECVRSCYERPGLLRIPYDRPFPCFHRPAVSQTSNWPAPTENALFYSNWSMLPDEAISAQEVADAYRLGNLVPLEECPDACNGEGICVLDEHNFQLGRRKPMCRCHVGRLGLACEQDDAEACHPSCKEHGKCLRGVCACDYGWFGQDCSLDLSRADAAVEPLVLESDPVAAPQRLAVTQWRDDVNSNSSVRVYVYQLPAWLSVVCASDHGWDRTHGYGPYDAFLTFSERLWGDNAVRTLDPESADAFFLPPVFPCTSNVGRTDTYVLKQVAWVRQAYSYWDRYDGADHFYLTFTDTGGSDWVPPELRRAIAVCHFGWSQPIFKPVESFYPERDVVVPCDCGYDDVQPLNATERRDVFFFFAGNVHLDALSYSHGVRQKMFAAMEGRPGVVFKEGRVGGSFQDYVAVLRRSVYCFAGLGNGWDQRLVSAVAAGCVPVIVLDNSWPIFFDLMNYTSFSVRSDEADIDRLYDRLRAIPAIKLRTMRRNLARVRSFFFWRAAGRAYESTIASVTDRAARGRKRATADRLAQPVPL